MDILNSICNIVQRTTLRSFSDWKVTGQENVPASGALIIVSNHQSNVDPSVLGACVPRRIRFLAKESIFRVSVASWFLTAYGAFPVNRQGVDVRSYRWSLGWLGSGGALALFPEGTRSKGQLIKANVGVARLAHRTNAPLLPVGIEGTERLGSIFRVFSPTGKIRVNIGEPFSLPRIDGKVSKEDLGIHTDIIMHHIADLLPMSRRGVYAAATGVDVEEADGGGLGIE